eukprot:CAMPEP_0195528336 /NCGR_PEP_ID=MMETSP0794_2-20130614/30428_1 /TAXON_ID=515487 /ORGANISM="Stephanopyxis turris, Strain CCMP 815" /LENGTH=152 /DNA_ID=CAMNT_0040659457 /DNA_START=247 /DNA_END=705 /DNA_ORIENTATION=+
MRYLLASCTIFKNSDKSIIRIPKDLALSAFFPPLSPSTTISVALLTLPGVDLAPNNLAISCAEDLDISGIDPVNTTASPSNGRGAFVDEVGGRVISLASSKTWIAAAKSLAAFTSILSFEKLESEEMSTGPMPFTPSFSSSFARSANGVVEF